MLITKFKHITQSTLTCVLVGLYACGVEVGNPKNPTGGDDNPKSTVVKDSEASLSLIAADTDTVINAISEDSAVNSNTGLIAFALARTGREREQTCSANADGSAVVNISASGSRKQTLFPARPRRSVVIETSGKKSRAVTWQSDERAISCTTANTTAIVNISSFNQLTASIDFSREFTFTATRKFTGVVLGERYFVEEGTRSMVWEKDTGKSDAETIFLNAELSKSIKRTVKVKTKRSGNKTLDIESTVKTPEKEPLKVSSEFSAADGSWQSRTIQSGTVITQQTNDSDSRLESEFDNVRFTKAGGCQPVSGTITGKIYDNKHDGLPKKTFVVTFSEDSAEISINKGEATGNYTAFPCEFDGD